MSDKESFGLSARDLMPNWASDLEKMAGEPGAPRVSEDQADYGTADRPARDRRPFDKNRRDDRGRGQDRSRDSRPPSDRGPRPPSDNRGPGVGGPARDGARGPGGPRPPWKDGPQRQGQGKGKGPYQGDRRGGPPGRHKGPPPQMVDPLPGVDVILRPTKQAVDALAKHIRSTGRAYPIFDVARMVMGSRDRYTVIFRPHKPKQGETPVIEPSTLFYCPADGSVWLTREEAINHASKTRILREYYDVEDVVIEPPKGNFPAVAVCGLSGRILGPPNHHDYQRNLQRLHRERYSDMPLERYKSRIEIRKDPETLEKWKELVTKVRHYTALTQEQRYARIAARLAEAKAAADKEAADKAAAEAAHAPAEPVVEAEPSIETSDAPVTEAADTLSVAEIQDGETTPETVSEEISPVTPEEASEAAEDESATVGTEESAGEAPVDPLAETTEFGAETESAPETAAAPREVLRSQEEVERHFRTHFADDAVRQANEAFVAGDVPGRLLSHALLEKLRHETEQQRRGFPLKLIQELCTAFESQGLRFFKRGKKALFVTVAKPRFIPDEAELTERIKSIVDFVRSKPDGKVVQMLAKLLPGYVIPKKGDNPAQREPFPGELELLSDLRWLVMEGYIIEYPDSRIEIAKTAPPPPKAPAPKADAEPAATEEAGPASAEETDIGAEAPSGEAASVSDSPEIPTEEPESAAETEEAVPEPESASLEVAPEENAAPGSDPETEVGP